MRTYLGLVSSTVIAVGLVVGGLSAMPDRASAAAGDVSIIALSCDTNPEYVRIKNFGGSSQSLTGFHIESDPSQDYTLTDFVSSIGAGQTLEFQSGSAAADSSGVYRLTGVFILRNSDPTDYARLVRPGATSDQVNCDEAPPDSDGDGVPDSTDNCPQWPNPGQGLPPWPVPAGDADCDGSSSADEGSIGTDPNDPCGLSAWPPDFDMNHVINTTDVFQVLPPVLGSSSGGASFSVRADLSPNGVINTTDVFQVLPPVLGSSCTV